MMLKKLKSVFTKISVAVVLCFLLVGCSNSTEKLISEHPVELITVEELIPFGFPEHSRYEMTPDLKVLWHKLDLYDESNSGSMYERSLTQRQYDAIVNAIAANDFISFPEEHERPQYSVDGPSREIAVTAGGTTYRSGGYDPTETNSRFANIWRTLASAGVFEEEGYTFLPYDELYVTS